MTITINTSRGSKTLTEALDLFKQAHLPSGDLLGIFNQLQGYPEGDKAKKYVLANPDPYSGKIKRIVHEMNLGRSVGAKNIDNKEDLQKFFGKCGKRAKISLTIRANQTTSIRRLLILPQLEIESKVKILLQCVAASGTWANVPRTFPAEITLSESSDITSAACALFTIIEKAELVSILEEKPKKIAQGQPLSDAVKKILADNPELFYDSTIYLNVCGERGFGHQVKNVGMLPHEATMVEVMMTFLANSSREEFLEFYVERFNEAVTPEPQVLAALS